MKNPLANGFHPLFANLSLTHPLVHSGPPSLYPRDPFKALLFLLHGHSKARPQHGRAKSPPPPPARRTATLGHPGHTRKVPKKARDQEKPEGGEPRGHPSPPAFQPLEAS